MVVKSGVALLVLSEALQTKASWLNVAATMVHYGAHLYILQQTKVVMVAQALRWLRPIGVYPPDLVATTTFIKRWCQVFA